MDQIFGFIERITFCNPETGFIVAKLKEPRKNDLTTIIGMMPGLQPGESVRCVGVWKNNPSHGIQFEVDQCHIEAPADVIGIKKYLASGLIKGIGPKYAEKIIEKFGINTLEIIEKNCDRLIEVPGLGEKRIEKIKQSWDSQKAIRTVMIFLQGHGISPGFAQKIYRHYGNDSIDRIRENPYQLANDINGIGFKKADEVAANMGFSKNSPGRIDSGILYVLSELSLIGHVCYPVEDFLQDCQKTLDVAIVDIQTRIEFLEKNEKIIQHEQEGKPYIWSKQLYLCEIGITREINRLTQHRSQLRSIDTEKALDWSEKQLKIALAGNQKVAVGKSISEKLHIITGGPGTGKSTITKAILKITSQLSSKIILAAPTGRAAKRMHEITGKAAATIHSLLQYDFVNGGFKRNRDNPLECDLIIIDEASMIDTYLMYSLLKAIPNQARVIFVGDIHQLPSVGPGNVLKDLIESSLISTTELKEIFRQAEGSKIITNAHKVNQGIFPDLRSESKSDFFFVKAEEPQDVLTQIIHLVTYRLPKFYRFNPIEQIQVLSPMKKGILGTENLNQRLQEKLNPQKEGINYSGRRFSVGDKVMQIRNNYQKEVFNGDIGIIIAVHLEEEELIIQFDDKPIPYQFHELEEIVLAYATSIHKYQGSECPCIVIPVHTTHFMMLHRNLLYTGITRGKKLVVLVGTGKAIAIAVGNDEVQKRHTGLKEALQSKLTAATAQIAHTIY